jgi:signal transduction histidine kinase
MLQRIASGIRTRGVMRGYAAAVVSVAVAVVMLLLMQARWHASAPASLFVIAVIATTWLGGTKPGLLAAALSILSFDYFMMYVEEPVSAWPLQLMRLLALAAVAAYVIWLTATERRAAESLRRARDDLQQNNEALRADIRDEQALQESMNRLQHLSRRLLAVQEDERRHLSRELHDEFGQLLATVTLHLHAAKRLAGEPARASLDESIALLQRAGSEVRSLALELRPMMLETGGLDAALRWLAEQHRQRTGIDTEVEGQMADVPGDIAIACFRVAQEALTNVARHAHAQHVRIEFGQGDGVVRLLIRDNGVGFDVGTTLRRAASGGHLGLLGMKERAEILGGELEIDSLPGHGTRISITLPLAEPVAPPALQPT